MPSLIQNNSRPPDMAAQRPREIPVAMPDISSLEQNYVAEAMRSGWISSLGPFVEKFERGFAEMCGTQFALGVTNGTMALHLALLGLDVRPGDEVLVPTFTYVATANAVRYVGAEPVFVDIDPNTWCIDPKALEDKITRRTRGIIAVHIYGHPADMDAINQLAALHGLWVVEDAAESHFGRYKGKRTGGLAQFGTFSFYGNKILTSGEGGAITLNDPQLYTRIKALRGQGVDPSRRYYFPIIGYNFRITNVACAILCAQLERGDEILERRLRIFDRYEQSLKDVPGVGMQPVAPWAFRAPWLFSITINEERFGLSRDDVMAILKKEGIDTRPFFFPLHRLPPYREMHGTSRQPLPHSDRLASAGLNLPTFNGIDDADIDRICEALANAARGRS
jgi:perosamine synthetase